MRISFRPFGYVQGQIARIMGDFTDWVPYTMHMHPMKQILKDQSKDGEFFVEVKLAKGLRYRFLFEVDGVEQVDPNAPSSANSQGKLTNFVEVEDERQADMTM